MPISPAIPWSRVAGEMGDGLPTAVKPVVRYNETLTETATPGCLVL
jgi:hypothetical protein